MNEHDDGVAFAIASKNIYTEDGYTGEELRHGLAKVFLNGKWVSQYSKEYKRYRHIAYRSSGTTDSYRDALYYKFREGLYTDVYTCDK